AEEMASWLGVTNDQVHSLCCGRCNLTSRNACVLELKTGVSRKWLLSGDINQYPYNGYGRPFGPQEFIARKGDEGLQKLVDNLASLNRAKRQSRAPALARPSTMLP